MTDGLLIDIGAGLELIVSDLAAALLPARVRRGGGAFDANELRRHAVDCPAVVVSCLGFHTYARYKSDWSVKAQLAAYVITRDAPPAPSRDLAALSLVTAVYRAVPKSLWGAPAVFDLPEEASLEATNLYSGDLDSTAVALWAVTWRQTLRLLSAPTP